MSALLHDLRFAIRLLRKSPGFTVVALITLALGIGANSAIFSAVYSLLLRPLPYEQPQQLVRVTADMQKVNVKDLGISPAELFDYRDSGLFSEISGIYAIDANLTDNRNPGRVEELLVDVNYFHLLGAKPQLGRLFSQEDYTPGIGTTAIISDGLWKRRYGSDPAIVGKQLRLDNDLYTIVGVARADFRHPGRNIEGPVEVWAPSGWKDKPFPTQLARRAYFLGGAIGRLKPGISLAAAAAKLDWIGRQFRSQFGADYPEQAGWTPRLLPLQEDLTGSVRLALIVLFAAVGMVLLIACANVANLQLARAATRQREMAVRAALGARRGQIVRQLLVESVVLSVGGGMAGLAIAGWMVPLMRRLLPAQLAPAGELRMEWPVLLFTFGVAVLTGIAFGLAPALHSVVTNLADRLNEAARGSSSGKRQSRTRSALIVSEFAVALVLLVGATLLVRSFIKLESVDPGFDPQNVQTARLWLPQPNIPETGPYFDPRKRTAAYNEILRRAADLPGVEVAAATTVLPLSGRRGGSITLEGRSPELAGTHFANATSITPAYFAALGIPLRSGRNFSTGDVAGSTNVAVVSEEFVRSYIPDHQPLGKRLVFGRNAPKKDSDWITIVGVAGDVREQSLEQSSTPQLYLSLQQNSNLALTLVLRTSMGQGELTSLLQREVKSVDPNLPVFGVRSMDEIVASSLGQRRFAVQLLSAFSVLALVLSAVGIYGVMAYSVAQRRRELCVRLALGARPLDIRRLVLNQGVRLAAMGLVIGLIGGAVATQAMRSLLFSVSPHDPTSFAGIALLLSGVAVVSSYLPARRAAAYNPTMALRD